MKTGSLNLLTLIILALGVGSGCAVHQPRGGGQYRKVKEPKTGGVYHLYLPVDYVKNEGKHPDYPAVKRWPLVMTFHGMKPYDGARPQEREWEQEADSYGYIVCAPELKTSSSFMEYPLTREHGYVLKDRERVMAIMDHVFETTMADPKRVLSTSWSCGGYLAHYFPNRYPERFSCIATRLSNFSAELMKEETVPRYRDKMSIAVFIGDGDLPKCKSESEEAVAWYTARNFRVVRGKMIDKMGHKRIPQTAAAFFAEQLHIRPLHPLKAAKTVAKVHMTEYYPAQAMIAKMSPPLEVQPTLARGGSTRQAGRSPVKPKKQRVTRKPGVSYASMNAGRNYPFDRPPADDPKPDRAGTSKGAGTTRVASAQGGRGNWLEPIEQPNRGIGQRSTRPTGQRDSGGKTRRANRTAPQPTPSRQPATQRPTRRKYEPSGRQASSEPRPSKRSGSTERNTHRRTSRSPSVADSHKPSASGSGDSSRRPLERRSTTRTQAPKALRPAASRPTPARRHSRARSVEVKLRGPTIGTAPHYLVYRIDMPFELTRGADFLWKDNGVWMGDEPGGVKILETPGLHQITVLMVTKDNLEYRGLATVHVLDPGPAVANYRRDTR